MFKKVIAYLFVLILILVLYEMAFSFLKTYHNINYTLIKSEGNYEINEIYTKKKSDDYYYIVVKNDTSSYIFSVLNTFNKRKNIVKDVEQININSNVSCLVLSLVDDSNSLPICLKDNGLYSYHALEGKYDLSSLKKYIKKYEDPKTKIEFEKTNSLNVNYGYIDDNEYIALYNLKEVLFFHNSAVEILPFSDHDIYKNTYGAMVGKYYLIPEVNNSPEIIKYMIYDVTSQKSELIYLQDHPINTKEMYINGEYDKSLYIVDKSNKVQYRINPKEASMQEVGNTNNEGYVYLDGVLSRENIYKLSEKEIVFSEGNDDYSSIKADIVFPQNNYAYYFKNGSFYKVYKTHLDYPIHLFEASSPNNIKVINNSIYFIDDDTLFKYNEYGLNKIITRDEFKYNYYNIFDVYVN